MEKLLFLLLLATIVRAENQEVQNSTCEKTVKTAKTSHRTVVCKTTTLNWGFWRKTAYRSCQKTFTTYTIEKVPVCCSGYLNDTGICKKAPCAYNTYGENCTLPCPCAPNQYERCDVNGTCLCSPGWTGENCSKACKQGWYGDDCKQSCPCKNNATCDHVTGTCNCISVRGKTGEMCDEDCPTNFYGLNCSSSCNCSMFPTRVCDSFNGRCMCESGKRGDNCTEECSKNTFGPDCTKSCACVSENSLSCNSSSGFCHCKDGWIGRICETRCDPYHFGEGCEGNCSCMDREVCNNENGTCFPASVCLASNTFNCLPSLNFTCQRVSENCNHSDSQQLSLKKEMLDICCRESASLMDSICITQGKCDCREKHGGIVCNETDLEFSVKGISPVTVTGVVVSLVIIVIAVVILVAVIRKRKPSAIMKNGISNSGYGTHALEDSRPMSIANSSLENQEYDTTQRQRGREQDQSEMYDLNRHDSNDYGYNTSTHKEREDPSENYASTAFDEEYDHLQRNNNKVQEADYSYSHQPFLTDNSDYNTAGMPVRQTDNDYDSPETAESQETMYSNTQKIISDKKIDR